MHFGHITSIEFSFPAHLEAQGLMSEVDIKKRNSQSLKDYSHVFR